MTTAHPPAAPATEAFRQLPLGELFESPLNPRQYFAKEALAELTASITTHGVITPLLARPAGKGFEIAAGHRRFRAAKAAGLTQVPVLVRAMTDQELLEILTIENLQREDVTPLEEATGYQQLIDKAGYDVKRIADRVGKSEKYIYDRIKLLGLGEAAKEALAKEKITPSHAILLARVEPEQQKAVLTDVLRHKDAADPVSVRELNRQIEIQVRTRQRANDIADTMAAAIAAHPDEKKIYEVTNTFGDPGRAGVLGRGAWQEAKSDTEGRLVGVELPDSWSQAKPKVIYFTRVKERAEPKRKPQPAYGSKEWKAQEEERGKRAKERDRRKAAAELAIRSAFAKAAKTLELRPFLATVVDQLVLHTYLDNAAIGLAFGELVGIKLAGGDDGRGMAFRLDKKLRGALPKLSADQLKAAALFLLAQPNKGGTYDTEAYERTVSLAKLCKIDMEAVGKAAATAAEAAHKGKVQASATAKVRKMVKRPKVKRKKKGG